MGCTRENGLETDGVRVGGVERDGLGYSRGNGLEADGVPWGNGLETDGVQ